MGRNQLYLRRLSVRMGLADDLYCRVFSDSPLGAESGLGNQYLIPLGGGT